MSRILVAAALVLGGAATTASAHHEQAAPTRLSLIGDIYPDLHARELGRPPEHRVSWVHLRRMAATRWARQHPAQEAAHRRRAARQAIAAWAAQHSWVSSCESGGDPRAVSASGQYRGKWQFDLGTWAGVGGAGDPAAAPEAEQDRRAYMLWLRRGLAPWPVCGRGS